ncbi:MAG: DUF6711 family protein [Ruminococcus sp.]|nr:DUF6711 family protein [Ruminococcus sp.]
MAFNGYLIKFTKTGEYFPHKLIAKSTYKSTPLQRTEIKAYRDSTNTLRRVTSPNYKTKIEFQTHELNLSQMTEIRKVLNSAFENSQQRKVKVTYWDDELLQYRTMTAYIPDITYNVISITSTDIKYSAVTFTFIEY